MELKQTAVVALLFAVLAAGSQAAQAGDPKAGRKKAAACQTCHGFDGVARIPNAPHIAGEAALYLETRLTEYRSGKRRHEMMSIIAAELSDQDISDLAAWYASIEITAKMPPD
jgi:cytochrome c553